MTYIDGFVIAVPTADKDKFVDHAQRIDKFFLDYGARRVVEGWGDNVPDGKVTDFPRSVQATPEEGVVFSWVEWPDKSTRNTAMKAMETNEAMMAEPMPFDGKRMIYGGFEPIVTHGTASSDDYIQGFLIPVPENRQEDYRKMADDAWDMFRGYGATSVVEAWGEDVPQGKQTDFYRAVKAEPGEKVVFSWMTWPDRATCDAASEKMQSDPNMKMPDDMPFDGKRMIWGGFEPVVVL